MHTKKRKFTAILLVLAMLFTLMPALPQAAEASVDNAYFYVLRPDYNGTLKDATKGDFYYVGQGSVEDVESVFDETGEKVKGYISSLPLANVMAFMDLKIPRPYDFSSQVGTEFSNVIWYRTVNADGANSNTETPIIENKNCWHVDGTVKPPENKYQVQFLVPELSDPLVAQYSKNVSTPITADEILQATKAAEGNAPTGKHIQWYLDPSFATESKVSTEQIVSESLKQQSKDILYIYGQYIPDATYSVAYQWSNAPTGKVYDANGAEVTLTLPNDDGEYVKGQSYTVDSKYTEDMKVYTHDEYGNINGTYTFSGWKLNDTVVTGQQTMGESSVSLTGEWKYTEQSVGKHEVTYEWTGLPKDETTLYNANGEPVTLTLPNDTVEYVKGQPYTVDSGYTKDMTVYTHDAYGNVNGKYTFSGWKLGDTVMTGQQTMGDSNVTLQGEWTYDGQAVQSYSLKYDANGGTGENIPTDKNTYVKNQTAQLIVDSEKSPKHNAVEGKDVVFIGWSTTQTNKIFAAGEDYGSLVDEVTFDNDHITVYAVWGYDEYGNGSEDGDGIPDAQQVVITPADITVYTGGTGYTGVLDGEDMTTTENGLPEPGYYFILPYALNKQINDGKETIADLSNELKLTCQNDNDSREWTLNQYNEKTPIMVGGKYIYRLTESGTNQKPARLEIHDGETSIVSDHFEGFDLNLLYKDYTMNLYTDNKVVHVQAKDSNDSWADINTIKGIALGVGKLTVRGTTDQDGDLTSEIQDSVSGEVSSITAEKTDNVTYYTNGSQIEVVDQNSVQLLVDEVVEDAQGALKDAIVDAAEKDESITIDKDYTFDFNYLDLVDTSNGNAYVTMGKDQTMTLFWPYPDNMNASDTYYIAHFNGLDRNYDDLDKELADKNTTLDIYSTDNEKFKLEKTDEGIKITTSSFSPFALVYDADQGSGGNTGGGGTTNPPALNTEDHFSYVVGYEDGMVKPENAITRAEVASIFYRLLKDDVRDENTTDVSEFSDVNASDWYGTTVATLSAMDIVRGYEDGTFRPNAPITRAEFAAIATRFFEETGAEYEPGTFDDVTGDEWFANAIADAVELGLIGGYPDGTVRPNNNITRAEACAVVNRTLGRIPHVDHLLPADEMTTWPDNNPSDWFYADMQEATNGHEYEWTKEDGQKVEEWTEILDKDWEDR